MKLELKHLAPYLPHGLKFKSKGGGMYFDWPNHVDNLVFEFDIFETPKHLFKYDTNVSWLDILNHDCKPILHPLSDLTKEIEVNGEKFIPVCLLTEYSDFDNIYSDKDNNVYCEIQENIIHFQSAIKEFNKLYEWHFDVFGLIEKGLAIDINTLNN